MSVSIQNHAKRVYLRLGVAILAFLIFLGMQLNLVFLDRSNYHVLASLAPLLVAFVALPRKVVAGEADMTDQAQLSLLARLGRLERYVMFVRLAFYALAFFAVLVLPRVVPPPQ